MTTAHFAVPPFLESLVHGGDPDGIVIALARMRCRRASLQLSPIVLVSLT